nr:hypothetical protein [Tanacetum cinerariifolium]
MSAKRTSWNEFSSSMASAVICFSSGDLSTHTTKYTSPALTQKVFANMRRVGKGFSRVETHLFENMLVEQQVAEEGDAYENDETVNAGDATEGGVSAAHGEVPTVDEAPSILSPTPPTPPPQPPQDIPSTSQVQQTPPQSPQALEITKLQKRVKKLERGNKGRMIAEVDANANIVLEDVKEAADEAKEDVKEAKEDKTKPAEVQEVIDVVTTSKLITEVVTAASETVTASSAIITAAEAQVPNVTLTAAPKEPKPLKKKQQIKQDEQYARELQAELNKNIDWDESIDHVKRKAKEDPAVKRYQVLKRKPQTEAQARKNIMMYLKNVAGFKLDYFKGMSYDDIRPIFKAKFNSNVSFLLKIKERIEEDENRALKGLNETPAERAAKRQSWMRREDLEALWSLVKERFSTTKPKNFSDDFLLVTLGEMFKKPDIHAQVWKTQRNVHGPAKVKGWKLLESCVRLEVEEESEVSLELLRFTRQQHKEGQLE